MSAKPRGPVMRMTEIDRRTALKLLGAGAGAIASAGAMPHTTILPRSSAAGAIGGTTLRRQIAAYVAAARFEDLPPAVIDKAKEQIVFFFGRAFASVVSQRGRHAIQLAQQIRHTTTAASVMGDRLRLAPADAALVNASLFGESLSLHALLHEPLHPGVITLPAALAIGEITHASGRELLLALVLGYEILGKLSQTAPSACRTTSIVAGYAATAAAGRLFGLDRERMIDALGYATGPCIDIEPGIDIEADTIAALYPGLICRNGMFAAHLAQGGALADIPGAVESGRRAHSSRFVDAQLPESVDELGYWEILTTLQSPYQGSGPNTAAIELLADLMHTHQLMARNIASIHVVVPASESRALDMERSARGPFTPGCRACSSVPYSLARVLADGRIDTARLADDNIVNDPAVARMMQTIEVAFEHDHGERWARVAVHTRDGRTLERASDFFTCELPPEMWHDWLRANGKQLLSTGQLLELGRLIRNLENVRDVSQLIAAATPAPANAHT